jgi:AcrR family transcriptional regulator
MHPGSLNPEGAPRRRRGRPPGITARGLEARRRLHEVAIALIAERGYEATTLRDIAHRAGVSAALLYRYFPSKRAVVLALYDALSAEYAARAARLRAGPWRLRFLEALAASLDVLGPHRSALRALVPVLVGGAEEGLFAEGTAFSRLRVQGVFEEAVRGASDAPAGDVAPALGRLLYLAHLAVILWWLLDRTPRQRATAGLVSLAGKALAAASLALRLRRFRRAVLDADALVRGALLGERALPRAEG